MKLRQKFIISFSAFSILLLTTTVYYLYIEFNEIIEDQIDDNLTVLAEAVEGQIFLFFEKAKMQNTNWSSDFFIRKEFEKILANGNEKDAALLINYLKTAKQNLASDAIIIDIFNTDNQVIISTHPGRINHIESKEELADEYAFDKAVSASHGDSFISPPTQESDEAGHETYKYMWHISSPIFSADSNKIIGVLVSHIASNEIDKILTGEWQVERGAITGKEFSARYETSDVYLVNNKNRVMITPSRFMENAAMSQKVETLPVKKCIENNEEFTGEYINYIDDTVNGASMCFKEYGLTLLIEVNRKEIFGPINKEKNHIILLGLSVWAVSIAGIFSLGNILLKNITVIKNFALEAIEKDFDVEINIKSKDEIGDLASAFDLMIKNIRNYRRQLDKNSVELKEANESLEKRVKERTFELVALKNSLERSVVERTKELQEKLSELEKFKRLTIGRELKMVELKKELEELKKHQHKESA